METILLRCPPGVVGQYCEEVVSPCHLNPCHNGGICAYAGFDDGRLEVTCLCPAGTSGNNCEINNDDCYTGACYHNGTCVDRVDSFDCICPPGFGGERCEVQTNECPSSPCSSEGTVKCIQMDNNFSCVCRAGYTGYRCDVLLDFCSQKPCSNNGTCVGFLRVCICQQGYKGEFCDEKIPEACVSKPCLNEGECLPGRSPFELYFCDCLAGTFGKNCGFKHLTNCLVNGCFNGGTCESRKGAFVCHCPPHFTGAQCQLRDTSFIEDAKIRSDINTVALGSNLLNDSHKKYICFINKCHIKANNGFCNPECNSYLCGFDGIDCAGDLQPFRQCYKREYCANVFRNELCDPQCNTEDCLFDGFDCLKIENEYIHNSEKYCEVYAGDGSCNEECNMTTYNFDSGDCLTDEQRFSGQLTGRIVAIVAVSSAEFKVDLGRFLIVLGNLLQAIIRVDTDKQGRKMIYQWNSKFGSVVGKYSIARLKMRTVETPSIKFPSAKFPHSTLVVLTVHKIPYNNASSFTNSSRVTDFLSVDSVKRIIKRQLGYEIQSVGTDHGNEGGGKGTMLLTITVLFICTMCITHCIILVPTNRRVRIARWVPPAELEMTERAGTSHTTTLSEPAEIQRSEILVPALISPENKSEKDHDENEKVVEISNKLLMAWLKWNYTADSHCCDLSCEEEREDEFQNTVAILPKEDLNCFLIKSANDSFSNPETQCRIIDELISSGADVNNRHGLHMSTPLITAVKNKQIAAIELLLRRGADPNLKDLGGRTALHHAVSVDCSGIVELLLNSGRCLLEEKDLDGCTAALLAAKRGKECFPIFCLLVDCDANLTTEDGEGKQEANGNAISARSCTHWAAQNNDLLILNLLWLRDALCHSQDSLGRNALFLAASKNCVQAVEFLDARGFDREARDFLNCTPLFVAKNNGYNAVTKLLKARQPKAIQLDENSRWMVMEKLAKEWKKELGMNKKETWMVDHSQTVKIANSTSSGLRGQENVIDAMGSHKIASPEVLPDTQLFQHAEMSNLQCGIFVDTSLHDFEKQFSHSSVSKFPDWVQRSDYMPDLPFIFQDKFQSQLWKLGSVGESSRIVSESNPRPDNINLFPDLNSEYASNYSEVYKPDERILSFPDFLGAHNDQFNRQISDVSQIGALQLLIPTNSSDVLALDVPCSFEKASIFHRLESGSESSDSTLANLASYFSSMRDSNSTVSENKATCFTENSAKQNEEKYLGICPRDAEDLYELSITNAADDCTILVSEEQATDITYGDSMEKPTEKTCLDNSQMATDFFGVSSAAMNLDLGGPSVAYSSPSFVPVSNVLRSTLGTEKMRQGRYIKKAWPKNTRYPTSSNRKQ
ncbi:Notch and Ank 2 and EGF and NOD domain containing protein [Trichuris trichiura]|uniref:Notch and Ank 2 and EGF and NOD domain containing protein n=1 Tax=Trichuris trichiura TaxID=36087 RepID=A0A077Z639_TRITR|nr:Notch and Ank 2 and EGF and NOD domain containing protein [Trichuris trichiura]